MEKKITVGQEVSNYIYQLVEEKLLDCTKKPTLAVVQVGNDHATNIYIKHKKRACDKYKFGFRHYVFDETVSTDDLVDEIDKINRCDTITGCIVQLPLPDHINKYKILNSVDPRKDVDCFNCENIARLYFGFKMARFAPATVVGIYHFLKYYKIETKGKTCVIIGKSNIVGKPLQLLLSDELDMACTTILCDKYTENLCDLTSIADILIVAAGKHHLINSKRFVKEGATVIDVGIHRIQKEEKIYIEGDVDYDKVKDRCSLITPVPGGVGPMTVASLIYNLVLSAYS